MINYRIFLLIISIYEYFIYFLYEFSPLGSSNSLLDTGSDSIIVTSRGLGVLSSSTPTADIARRLG
jgi:hypothetical protein